MNTKFDQWFAETATDPQRRREAIVGFTRQRIILVGAALIVTACAVFMHYTAARKPTTSLIGSFAAFMAWVLVIRLNSYLKVLKLLEQFSFRDEKPPN